jgi:SAM-dependent methyltransferase
MREFVAALTALWGTVLLAPLPAADATLEAVPLIPCPMTTSAMPALDGHGSDVRRQPNMVTAEVDRRGRERVFLIDRCSNRVTLPEIYGVFAAHQVEWNVMGKGEAWWSVLTDLPRANANIPEERKLGFYSGGRDHVQMVYRALTSSSSAAAHAVYSSLEQGTVIGEYRRNPCTIAATRPDLDLQIELLANGVGPGATYEKPFGAVLDFGCGLGRLAFGFAPRASKVFCIDQSVHHLALAATEWAVRRPESIEKERVMFVPSSPDLIAAVRGTLFDFVHSVIVMQHMVPALQAVYLEQFCDILKEGGTGCDGPPLFVNSDVFVNIVRLCVHPCAT